MSSEEKGSVALYETLSSVRITTPLSEGAGHEFLPRERGGRRVQEHPLMGREMTPHVRTAGHTGDSVSGSVTVRLGL